MTEVKALSKEELEDFKRSIERYGGADAEFERRLLATLSEEQQKKEAAERERDEARAKVERTFKSLLDETERAVALRAQVRALEAEEAECTSEASRRCREQEEQIRQLSETLATLRKALETAAETFERAITLVVKYPDILGMNPLRSDLGHHARRIRSMLAGEPAKEERTVPDPMWDEMNKGHKERG